MSETSSNLLKYFHTMIEYHVSHVMNMLSGSENTLEDLLGGNLTLEDIQLLRTIALNEDQKRAMRRLLVAVCRLAESDIFSVIDGIATSEKIKLPELVLVDRNSGKDIAEDTLLNEEFYQVLEE